MSVKILCIVVVCLAYFTPQATSSTIRIAEAVEKSIEQGVETAVGAKKEIGQTLIEGSGSCLDGINDVVKGVVKLKTNIISKVLNIGKTIVTGAIKVGASIVANKIALLSSPPSTPPPCNQETTPAPTTTTPASTTTTPAPPAPPAPTKPDCPPAQKPSSRDVVFVNDVDYYRLVPQHGVNCDEQQNVILYY